MFFNQKQLDEGRKKYLEQQERKAAQSFENLQQEIGKTIKKLEPKCLENLKQFYAEHGSFKHFHIYGCTFSIEDQQMTKKQITLLQSKFPKVQFKHVERTVCDNWDDYTYGTRQNCPTKISFQVSITPQYFMKKD